MREIGFAHLLRPGGREGRAFFHNIWFRDHNNARMAALLPRLAFVDVLFLYMPRARIPRGLAFRVAHRTRAARYGAVLSLASRRYSVLFTNAPEQARYFRGPVVTDLDDPTFSSRELALLSLPNIARCVVTSDEAVRRYEELGVRTPTVVIPQGVDLSGFSAETAATLRRRLRREGDVVAVFHAAWLRTSTDRGGHNPLYNVDGLLQLWRRIQAGVPRARLWLIGRASRKLQEAVVSDPSTELLGYLPQRELPNYLANADVALYPRHVSHVRRAVKVAECLAVGVPVVGFDLPVLGDVRESGGGLLARSEHEFVEATVAILCDRTRRTELSQRARAYGTRLEWDKLAVRYAEEAFAGLPVAT